eukprot:TRINITY_DN5528_c0_g1_i8.p1 TRINITY_DN5528_c0_g1~~TRINITY_DN5528_c0_g1_i8.p1  ORF type:complete len:538 (+),score=176.90 TRINITY_DN5528_c0_g1_i8:1349-2962(+)
MKIDLQSIYNTERFIRYDHMAYVQGILNCGFQPKYKQLGSPFIWHPGYYYFAAKIEKASGLDQLEDITDLEVYATVEWGGQVQRTRCVCDASIPVFNEIFYFLIPLGDAELKDEQKLIEALKGEFQNKSRVWISLWRKFYGGILMHLGSASFNIGNINDAKPDDITFVTDDKRSIIYETRVLAKNLSLSSAFNPDLMATVSCKAWFFQDLPSSLDLSPYKRESDDYPYEIEAQMNAMAFELPWRYTVSDIYEHSEVSSEVRKFDVFAPDHCRRKHFLPLYLSSMSPPDQGSIEMTSYEYDHKIRMLGEVAHYVRSIPYTPTHQNFWVAPSTTLAIRKGTGIDHAILMASLFLGCSFEVFADLRKAFRALRAKEKRALKGNDKAKHGLRYYEDQMQKLLKKEKLTIEKNDKTVDDEDEEEENERSEEDNEEGEGGSDEIPLNNRVFICVGTDKAKKEQCLWVMTFNKECNVITLWDPRCHAQYQMNARVKDVEKLREFLKYKPKPEGSLACERRRGCRNGRRGEAGGAAAGRECEGGC